MTDKYTGRCACGNISITVPKPTGLEICHCMDCRRFSGTIGGHYLLPRVEAEDLEVKDNQNSLGKWTAKADSGNMIHRHFCKTCSSPLYDTVDRPNRTPDAASVYAGLFDSKTLPAPTEELYWSRAEKWEKPHPGAKISEEMDT